MITPTMTDSATRVFCTEGYGGSIDKDAWRGSEELSNMPHTSAGAWETRRFSAG